MIHKEEGGMDYLDEDHLEINYFFSFGIGLPMGEMEF